MATSNINIAKLLREIAAVYTIHKKSIFEIRAYQNAADSIEHLTTDLKDLWEEGKLDLVPGLGKSLRAYLDELFKTGKVAHFETVKKSFPEIFFDLLDISGVGPKTAEEIANLGVKNLNDLKAQIKSGKLVEKGFSAKIAEKIIQGLDEAESKTTGRMLLPYANAQANKILDYLKKCHDVGRANFLGSLRRQLATIGDLDFAIASKNPKKVVEYFVNMPGVARVIDKGESKGSVVLQTGLQVDLLVGEPESYGALLQHFTGSKNHNIHLRTLAEKKGLSLSEYGVSHIRHPRLGSRGSITKTDKLDSRLRGNDKNIIQTKTEDDFYKLLGMETPPPEIREDTGEIEAAMVYKLPNLVESKDIKGDLHTHSNFPFPNPSHGPGVNPIEAIIEEAIELKYDFIGISDHPPGHGAVSKDEMIKAVEKRTKYIQKLKQGTKSIRVLNGLEIDILPDGTLSVPDEALQTLDYCIAGIHSAHRGNKEQITKRILSALANPSVDIISHPTNRLLNERESSDADWETIFKFAGQNNKIMEINAYPNRLDLRDDLVRLALSYGVKFIINSDAHEISQMDTIPYGVSVARRGWAEKKDVVNTWSWTDFVKWFTIK